MLCNRAFNDSNVIAWHIMVCMVDVFRRFMPDPKCYVFIPLWLNPQLYFMDIFLYISRGGIFN